MLVLVLGRFEQLEGSRASGMAFDHEKLDVYRLAGEFNGWVGALLDGPLAGVRSSANRHLDEAAGSIDNDIAEGNGKRSSTDRCRFLDIARGSALECAACLDTLIARRELTHADAAEGKKSLERLVSMLWRMIQTLQSARDSRTSTSTSTSTSTKPDRGSRSLI